MARTPKGRSQKAPAWQKTFLEALREVPNVSAACELAGIERRYAYKARDLDEEFAKAWGDAVDAGLDALEQTIYLRARIGQPTTKITRRTDGDGNLIDETVVEDTHISDTLAMFFLKRFRPEFRERYTIEQTGEGGGPVRVSVVDETAANFYSELDRLGREAQERQDAELAADEVT